MIKNYFRLTVISVLQANCVYLMKNYKIYIQIIPMYRKVSMIIKLPIY